MPENLDELFAAAATGVASRTRPPGAAAAIRTTRRRTAAVGAAVVTAAVVGVAALTLPSGDGASTEPAPPPVPQGVDLGEAVWYDADGLHRGRSVTQTAVPLRPDHRDGPPLTLVRTGALYADPARQEIWFHPWDGEPRVVGTDAASGPSGDPASDVAAWFEGRDLVVYDTAADREVRRISVAPRYGLRNPPSEHIAHASPFLEVSPGRVVWLTDQEVGLTADIADGELTTIGAVGPTEPVLIDTEDGVELRSAGHADLPDTSALRLLADGGEVELTDLEAGSGRLSPDGTHLVAVTERSAEHQVVVVEVASTERSVLPATGQPLDSDSVAFVSWSYGSTVLVLTQRLDRGEPVESAVRACDADSGDCVDLPSSGRVVLPY